MLVLTGGGVNFCAGADLSTVEDEAFVALLRDTLETLRRVPIPVVAAIRGPALGAGTQLALACDLRLATSGATFGIPAGKLGLTVDHWTVQQLARQAGHSIARAMLVGAEVFDGRRLAQSGFVHRLVDDDADVLGEALAWADSLSHLAPLTLAAHKAMLDAAEVAEEASTRSRRPASPRGAATTSSRASPRSPSGAGPSSAAADLRLGHPSPTPAQRPPSLEISEG